MGIWNRAIWGRIFKDDLLGNDIWEQTRKKMKEEAAKENHIPGKGKAKHKGSTLEYLQSSRRANTSRME